MIDAFKRASAGRITAVVPYYAYGRSDKKDQPRVPITARLIADMITVAGADRVLTMDLHQGQIQGFFNIPVDELTAVHMLSRYFIDKHLRGRASWSPTSASRSAPGRSPRSSTRRWPSSRSDATATSTGPRCINVIGEVHGRRAIIVDDEIDTAGTLIETVRALEREGVTEIYACATHGVLSDPAVDRIARLEPARGGHHRHRPAAAVQAAARRSRCCRSRRSSARPSSASTAASRSGRCSRREVSFTQEMLLWEDGPRTAPGGDAAADDDDVPSPMPASAGA